MSTFNMGGCDKMYLTKSDPRVQRFFTFRNGNVWLAKEFDSKQYNSIDIWNQIDKTVRRFNGGSIVSRSVVEIRDNTFVLYVRCRKNKTAHIVTYMMGFDEIAQ